MTSASERNKCGAHRCVMGYLESPRELTGNLVERNEGIQEGWIRAVEQVTTHRKQGFYRQPFPTATEITRQVEVYFKGMGHLKAKPACG